jgi:hypothetical protein
MPVMPARDDWRRWLATPEDRSVLLAAGVSDRLWTLEELVGQASR